MQGMVLSQVPPPTGREEVPHAIPTGYFDVCRNHIDRVRDRTDIVAASNSNSNSDRNNCVGCNSCAVTASTNPNTCPHVGSYADIDSNTDADANPNSYPDTDSDTTPHSYPDAGSNGYTSTDPNAGSNGYTSTDPNAGSNGYTSTDPNAGPNGYTSTDPNADTHTDALANSDIDA